MQNYQVLETPSSSRSNPSPCSSSSSPIISKSNGKQSSSNKSAQIQNLTNKTQNLGASESDRPPHSYIALISMAILSKIDRKILLNEIYDWVIQNFPYYQSRTDKSWRNSIRHNLSLNECFIKVGKAGNGRGYYWSIHSANLNDFKKGDFRRRQARLRAKHDKNHTSPNSKPAKEIKEKAITNQPNQTAQNFQNNFYQISSSSSSYTNSDFGNFNGQNAYQAYSYPNTSSYENNEYFYSFNNDQNINESNYLSPNISSSSVSSKESSSSNGLLSTTSLNQTPLTPLTPITTNNKSSSSSSTSSSLSSSPLSSTNVSSSSCLFNQNYNHFNSNAWFQQPSLDQFQTNNVYSYPNNNSANMYQNQTYYGYNTQTSLNQSNNSILLPINNESNIAETLQPNMDNLIYCSTSNQANDYAQYTNRPNFSFL